MADLSERVGRRIRTLRTAAGLSQAQLADAERMSRAYLGAVERGEKSPTLETLERIAHGLAVEPRDLFEPASPTDAKSGAKRLGHLTATLARRASKRDLERLERLVRAYFG